jgi:hypothetical protein
MVAYPVGDLAALRDAADEGRLACVPEVVGDPADQPHAQ